ncbi:MAG: T9SS type A sorting domain-containing protein [Candidatus Marinimicrobia bacterium]|jgi:hypothetical protein|nr:T9SS type A sorting domain-containing protein [Candidatus Neomarinimicrobiota bacterium]MBT3617653.1 T9SS type A sorting domain-containing protein [Candidatus Neomarinimicrobiota bacterium]MBT3829073.1 T9SS type A sorting domain-containing protein [Candidatus Neomarinimicrobiota bacterium]MBT3997745.1 T9SS type A sorting domain-containing protein [Candidatus Neomarinimicrobiota bacterium]MBT4281368.1 T9SS type A sorting domain-containing protein [Candidatus Neomarinimicrobiota bacterium]
MNLRLSKCLLILFAFSDSMSGQFLDMADVVDVKLVKTFDQRLGSTLNRKFDISIENIDPGTNGILIKLQGSKFLTVQMKFMNSNDLLSSEKTAIIYPEPFSDRLLAVYKGIEFSKSKHIEITIISDFEFQILSTGFLIPEQEEIIDSLKLLHKTTISHILKPSIISREEWNAKPPQFGYSSMPYYDKLTLHHAAGFSATNIEEGIVQMQAIQELHQDVRGWSDIGYHFVVDKGGNIYQARPETVLGAHTSGANTGNIGVCVLGCYHPPETSYFCYDEMSDPTRESITKLYAWISEQYGYENPHILKGHRDYYDYQHTACPGDNIWVLLPELRDEISLYLEFGDMPRSLVLHQNYPNPFNLNTTIPFDVSIEENVTIQIVDILGRTIKTLTNSTYEPSFNYEIKWDGKDENGKRMSSGLYLYRIRSSDQYQAKKMILLW